MEYSIGMFARSLAGHDKGKLYLINEIDNEYVYLVDGKIRTIENPKKKKKKHIQIDYQNYYEQHRHCGLDPQSHMITNENIKRAIKLKEGKNSSN